ncbi:hypothetical protein PSACC_03693 [Paramicrosporidium saccamoebae]|uniref:Glycoside hydrolase family 19 catalytic domain-containing protein n=1 Tax=Paramicrosporidium saccamoebae TaxID=1246581 RepID=A0A2H9TFJ6_9FUNG|nr:hypothetical protein PSACC_03693 [Paramicrosporidium saccamoebae]
MILSSIVPLIVLAIPSIAALPVDILNAAKLNSENGLTKTTASNTSAGSSSASGASAGSSTGASPSGSADSGSASSGGGQAPTFEQFSAAVSGYAKTSAGGTPPAPSKDIYDAYVKYVSKDMSLKEQALFLANIIWETAGLQHFEEVACKTGSCAYGKYYGRGGLHLTHDYNYKEASTDIYKDDRLVTDPSLVAKPEGTWRTALWFWNKRVVPKIKEVKAADNYILGPTIKMINGIECPANQSAKNRLAIYNEILNKWGIATGSPGKMDGCDIATPLFVFAYPEMQILIALVFVKAEEDQNGPLDSIGAPRARQYWDYDGWEYAPNPIEEAPRPAGRYRGNETHGTWREIGKDESYPIVRPSHKEPPIEAISLSNNFTGTVQTIEDLDTETGTTTLDEAGTAEATRQTSTPTPTPTPRPWRRIPKRPSYEEFSDAIDAYSVTNIGGHPPKPSIEMYYWYQDLIARKMSLSEQAMFLANVVWETVGLIHTEEIACRHGGCVYGKYFGRGCIQLTWDYNYRDASYAIFGNDLLLREPELVTRVDISWKTAHYYWQRHVAPVIKNGALDRFEFGHTIMAINGPLECGGRAPAALERLRIYNEILMRWGIDSTRPGTMTGCYVGPYYFRADKLGTTETMEYYETETIDETIFTTPWAVATALGKIESQPTTTPIDN